MTGIYGDALIDKDAINQLLTLLSQEEVNDILRSCLEDAESRVTSLKALRLPDDLQDLQWNVHDLKSTAGQLGATRLSKVAEEIDIYCKSLSDDANVDLDYIEVRLKEIINLFTDVADALHNSYLCQTQTPSAKTG